MGQEKMHILNMVKDGIITVDDGVKLLRALNTTKSNTFNPFTSNISHNMEKVKDQVKDHTDNIVQKTKNTFSNISGYINDITFNKNNPDTIENTTNTEYFNSNFS